MLCNGKVGKALDTEREDPRLVDRYGRHLFGRSLLIARRLVEAGVPVVQATMGIVQTWDTHVANFPRLRDSLLPPLDQAVSALLDDLKVRGLLDETLVVMLGEFGRTPADRRAEARRRPRPRPLAGRLPGGLRRRRGGRRPGDRQVRPPGRLSGLQDLRPARPGRDGLPRPRRRPGDRAPRPPGPARAALLGRGDDAALHDGRGLGILVSERPQAGGRGVFCSPHNSLRFPALLRLFREWRIGDLNP